MNTEKLYKLIRQYEKALAENRIPYLDPSQFIDIANQYWDDNREEDAHSTLINALRIHPDNNEIQKTRVELCLDEGNLVEAREIMDEIRPPYTNEIQCLNAELYMEEGQKEEALAILDALLQTSADEDTLIDLAKLYVELGKKKKAIQCLVRLDKISPDNIEAAITLVPILTHSGKFDEAVWMCNQIIDDDPYSFRGWMRMAECHFAMAEHSKVIEAAEFAMIADPAEDTPYMVRAQGYIGVGNYEKALEDLYRILNSNDIVPRQYTLYYIGICQMYLRDYEAAFESFNKAELLIKKPDEPFYHHLAFYMSRCQYYMGRYDESKLYAKKMKAGSNDERLMNILLSAAESRFPNKTPDEWEETILDDPSPENCYNLGITYLENGVYDKAIEIFLFLKEEYPEIELLSITLLLSCLGANDKNKIIENLQFIRDGLIKIDPENRLELNDLHTEAFIEKISEIFSCLLVNNTKN